MQNYGGGAGGLLLLFMDRGYRTVKRTTIITRNSLSRFLSTGAGLGASISLVSHNVSTVVVAVGAPLDNYHSGSTTFTESGSVVVLYLAMDGSVEKDYRISDLRNVQDLTSAALSPSTGAHFGSAVAGVSDLDQDGSSDLFVGSSGSGCCGAFVELFMEYTPRRLHVPLVVADAAADLLQLQQSGVARSRALRVGVRVPVGLLRLHLRPLQVATEPVNSPRRRRCKRRLPIRAK